MVDLSPVRICGKVVRLLRGHFIFLFLKLQRSGEGMRVGRDRERERSGEGLGGLKYPFQIYDSL